MAMVSVQENSGSINVHASCKIKATTKYTLCDGVVTILSLLLYVADIVTGKEMCQHFPLRLAIFVELIIFLNQILYWVSNT